MTTTTAQRTNKRQDKIWETYKQQEKVKDVKMAIKTFDVNDVINAEFNLEPLKCLKCNKIGEVTYNQYIGDGQCGYCGEWQLN